MTKSIRPDLALVNHMLMVMRPRSYSLVIPDLLSPWTLGISVKLCTKYSLSDMWVKYLLFLKKNTYIHKHEHIVCVVYSFIFNNTLIIITKANR